MNYYGDSESLRRSIFNMAGPFGFGKGVNVKKALFFLDVVSRDSRESPECDLKTRRIRKLLEILENIVRDAFIFCRGDLAPWEPDFGVEILDANFLGPEFGAEALG